MEDLKKIVHVELMGVAGRMKEKGITLTVAPAALEFLIDKGYNPEMGARPLRRAIENYVEDELSEEILRGNAENVEEIVIDKKKTDEKNKSDEGLTFKYIKKKKAAATPKKKASVAKKKPVAKKKVVKKITAKKATKKKPAKKKKR